VVHIQNRRVARNLTFWRIGSTLSVALVLVACAAPSGSSSPGASPSGSAQPEGEPDRTPSAECITPPVDLLTLINQTDPVACYGDTELTVEAEPMGVGAIDCGGVEPAWFGCSAWVALQPIVMGRISTGFVLAATTGPPALLSMFAAIHPETAVVPNDIYGEQLRITGHFDDPAAQTCVETEAPFGVPSDPDDVIEGCRGVFVMTAFERV
jgi:hypothetical protein